nr:acyltransferase family protein [Sporolactobacillus nakayamae]
MSGVVITGLISNNFSGITFIKACLPVITSKYWYITCYFLLVLFSPFINQISEKLEKKKFEALLITMLFVFSIIPSIFQFHVMNDGGKGLANMILMYLIGRYIKTYWNGEYKKIWLSVISIFSVCATFIMNMVLSILRGGIGIEAPFARDCSITIILSSVAIFMLFREFHYKSILINILAKHVVVIYVFEGTMRTVLNQYIDIISFEKKWYLFAIVALYVIAIMAICIIVNLIRSKSIGKLDKYGVYIILKIGNWSFEKFVVYFKICKQKIVRLLVNVEQ